MKRICVFCGAAEGARPAYAEAARRFGAELVRRGLGLVYGGCAIGMMGILADTVLARGGEVIGVIPKRLASRELAHTALTELRVVESMHERKATMGGLGTLDETFEALTWAQLGLHRKPVGALNVEGYWDGLRSLIEHAVRERFVSPQYAGLLLFADTPAELLEGFEAWRAPETLRA